MNPAIILGNGTTRASLNLKQLKLSNPLVPIFGCNAIYRDFEPDFLVAIDDGMIKEIEGSSFPKEKFIAPPEQARWEPKECNPLQPRSNAGMNALLESIRMGHDVLLCFGFDFLVKDWRQSTSNIYDGSPNYGITTRAVFEDNKNRCNFLNWLCYQHPSVRFTFAFPKEILDNLQMHDLFAGNFKILAYEDVIG